MAKETAVKKRKASAPDVEIEKLKKVKQAAAPAPEAQAKKRKAAEEASSPAVKKSKSQVAEDALKVRSTKIKANDPVIEDLSTTTISRKSSKKTQKTKAKSKKFEEQIPSDFENDDDEAAAEAENDEGSDSEIDDQTEALLKGFESDGDNEEDNGQGLEEGQSVPKVPKLSKAEQKLLKERSDEADEKPRVVYVGRIPHGFYEYEMKEYFKQFGTILKLRLSRNRKTGASRHYAFIQFESATVADIVARTMDNYLLFGHILKVKTVPDEQLSPELWKGANKRFKKVPWNKLEGRQLKQGASEQVWDKRVEKEKQRRAAKQKKLASMNYQFEQPSLKSAKGVAAKAALANGDSETLAIEAAPTENTAEVPEAVEAAPKAKSKRQKNNKAVEVTETVIEAAPAAALEGSKPKRTKKQITEVAVLETPADIPEKPLKSKKSKTALTESNTVAEESSVTAKKTRKAKK